MVVKDQYELPQLPPLEEVLKQIKQPERKPIMVQNPTLQKPEYEIHVCPILYRNLEYRNKSLNMSEPINAEVHIFKTNRPNVRRSLCEYSNFLSEENRGKCKIQPFFNPTKENWTKKDPDQNGGSKQLDWRSCPYL